MARSPAFEGWCTVIESPDARAVPTRVEQATARTPSISEPRITSPSTVHVFPRESEQLTSFGPLVLGFIAKLTMMVSPTGTAAPSVIDSMSPLFDWFVPSARTKEIAADAWREERARMASAATDTVPNERMAERLTTGTAGFCNVFLHVDGASMKNASRSARRRTAPGRVGVRASSRSLED
jgi:hypothetical protein